MLPFFPYPYPDETFYSLLARYNINSGNLKSKHTIEDLYGVKTRRAVSDFAICLEVLLRKIPGFPLDAEEIIQKHTLYPYYSAFIPFDRVRKIKSKIINGESDVHTLMGISAGSITNSKSLKHCLKCIEDDMNKYGETYWHRIHQIPEVFICPIHNVPLLKTKNQLYEFNQHEFVPASVEFLDFNSELTFDKEMIEMLIMISHEVHWLLNNEVIMPNYSFYKERYISILQAKELATANQTINQQKWVQLFTNHYGESLLRLFQSEIDKKDYYNWLSSIVRKHRSVFHPIRHILVIKILCNSLQEFYSTDHKYSPFGRGPWPCLNPAHKNYRRKIIRSYELSTCINSKRPLGKFKCSCGFIYTRRGPDTDIKDQYKKDRIINFGEVWKEHLLFLHSQELPIGRIAMELGVDSKTVIKQLSLLKDIEISPVKKAKGQNKCICNREKWDSLIKRYPNYSVTQIRRLNPGLFMWLYKYDRQWLSKHSPKVNGILVAKERVSWAKRDEELFTEVQEIIKKWSSYEEEKGKLIRKTYSSIANRTQRPHFILKKTEKLPKTLNLLQKICESNEGFRLRRIDWAAGQLIEEGKIIKSWSLLKKSSIRSEYVNSTIIQYMEKYCHSVIR
ncbi:TnsD family Tn7-like transposition protein [Siminovitchia acidinfaciens]|nr:TnsD family Tn7-like transposition protein [Siminovitchia acidinfaciens]